MSKKSPYEVIKHQHITEKAMLLQELKTAEGKPDLTACEWPKYVFIVDVNATKTEIKMAIEEIYKEHAVNVVRVNTILVKPKPRRMRGRRGFTSAFKKAIITLDRGDSLDNV